MKRILFVVILLIAALPLIIQPSPARAQGSYCTWSHVLNFGTSAYGFVQKYPGEAPMWEGSGQWSSGQGIVGGWHQLVEDHWMHGVEGSWSLGGTTHITFARISYTRVYGFWFQSGQMSEGFGHDNTVYSWHFQPSTANTMSMYNVDTDNITIFVRDARPMGTDALQAGTTVLTSMTIKGTGTDPFPSAPAGESCANSSQTPLPPSETPANIDRTVMETIVPPASCGSTYNPCSALPWAVPVLPTIALPSPTLMMVMADVGSTPVPGGTPTPTPSPTATIALVDTSNIATVSAAIADAANTLSAMSAATVEVEGTAVSVADLGTNLSSNLPGVFGTIKGVLAATNNKAMGIVRFLFLAFVFVLLVYLFTMTFPLIVRVIEFILSVITAVKPF